MKKFVSIFIFGGLFLSACDERIDIQVDPFLSKPVVYCMIDPNDSVHYVRLERVFSGLQAPALSARQEDSLLYRHVRVTALLSPYSSGGKTIEIEADPVTGVFKDSGYFANRNHRLYAFTSRQLGSYHSVTLRIEVPGLPTALASCRIIGSPVIWSPNSAQKFIYIVPDSPLRIQWSGGPWNEVDIQFGIREQYADSLATRIIRIQKVNDVMINGKYYEVKVPFELLVQRIGQTMKPDKRIIRRYFGPVNFTIHTGLEEFARYMEFQDGINDFNSNPFSNIVNGLGLLSSRSSVKKGPMDIDQDSRFQLAADPVLARLGFLEY